LLNESNVKSNWYSNVEFQGFEGAKPQMLDILMTSFLKHANARSTTRKVRRLDSLSGGCCAHEQRREKGGGGTGRKHL
jgi:hypothetical protein